MAILTLCGVLCALAAPHLPGGSWIAGAALAVFVTLCTPLRRRRDAALLAAFLAGFAWLSLAGTHWLERRLEPASGDERLLVEGVVVGVPARDGAELRFEVDTGARRLRLSWREAEPAPRAGERWRWLVRRESLAEARNFTGIDLERLALRDGIHARGRVLPSALNQRITAADWRIDAARERIAEVIESAVVDRDAAGLLRALAVGVTSGMSTDQWRVFNATGTSHLVAISGMHVTAFAWLAFAIARRVWKWLPGLAMLVDREPFALCAGLAAATVYALLAGFSVPTQRTLAMLSAFVAARLLARRPRAGNTLGLALIAVLLIDPLAPLAAGFWLSFLAVAAILVCVECEIVPPGRIGTTIRTQLAVLMALAPVTLALFGTLSLAALWVNCIAIPVISFVLVPLVLAGAAWCFVCEPLARLCFAVAGWVYRQGWPALVAAADAPLAILRVAPGPTWYLCAALAVGVAFLASPWRWRVTALFATVPLMYPLLERPAPGGAWIEALDLGRGSAVLVRTHAHALLFDTGDTWNTQGAPTRRVLLPALDAARLDSVDLLVLPRLTPDRAAGAAALAFERDVSRVLVGGGWPGSRLPAATCAALDWTWEGVRFQTFATAASCSLRISTAGGALFLAGDLDAAGERQMLLERREQLASEVTIVARGGSAAASSAQWIDALDAREAWVAGGADSGSRRTAIARWQAACVLVRDIREEGALALKLDARGIEFTGSATSLRFPFFWRAGVSAGSRLRYSAGPCGNSCGPAAHSCGRSSSARLQPLASSSNDSGPCNASASCPPTS